MASYCVFTADRRPLTDPGAVVLVRDGFAWPAALLSVPWAAAHELWFEAAALAGAQVLLASLPALIGLEPASAAALLVGLGITAGAHAADIRCRSLGRHGYRVDGLVVARRSDEAFHRYVVERRLVPA